jgi:ABC-type glycerol-3-phosphate transport system permease component
MLRRLCRRRGALLGLPFTEAMFPLQSLVVPACKMVTYIRLKAEV